MARDYKPAGSRTDGGDGGKKRGMNPMFIGIIIGLLLGIGLALGLAIWLNRANNPFIEKSRPIEALPTIPSRTLAAPDTSRPPFSRAKRKSRASSFIKYYLVTKATRVARRVPKLRRQARPNSLNRRRAPRRSRNRSRNPTPSRM